MMVGGAQHQTPTLILVQETGGGGRNEEHDKLKGGSQQQRVVWGRELIDNRSWEEGVQTCVKQKDRK